MKETMKVGIGQTPQLCQDALIEMLCELFAGKKYNGQEGRKPLAIFKQDLPIPEENDVDADTDVAHAPHICGTHDPAERSPTIKARRRWSSAIIAPMTTVSSGRAFRMLPTSRKTSCRERAPRRTSAEPSPS